MQGDIISTVEAAREITDSPLVEGSVHPWQIRRLFALGDLAEALRIGGKRVLARDQLPTIVAALRSRGWLPANIEETANPESRATGKASKATQTRQEGDDAQ